MDKEHIRYWRDPDLHSLEIRLSANSAHSFPHHTHDCYTIGVMEQGRCFVLGPGHGSIHIGPGQMCLINPGQVHSGIIMDTDARVTYRMFFVQNHWLRRMAGDLRDGRDALPEFHDLTAHTPVLSARLQKLNALVHGHAEPLEKDAAMMQAMAGLFFAHGGIHRPRTGSEPAAVRRAREYLNDNLSHRVSLDTLATVSGLSRYHFLRVFKKATGLPPHRFHLQCRVDRAKGLLLSGMSIAETAQETGFADQSHFTHKFKLFTGATPAQYVRG